MFVKWVPAVTAPNNVGPSAGLKLDVTLAAITGTSILVPYLEMSNSNLTSIIENLNSGSINDNQGNTSLQIYIYVFFISLVINHLKYIVIAQTIQSDWLIRSGKITLHC